MSKTLIINFANISKVHDNGEFDLLDIRYTIKNVKNCIQEMVDLDLVIPLGLELYKKFIQEILKDNQCLTVRVDGFPVYWLTECAIKGYAWHWGRDFFLLLQILQSNQNQFEKNYNRVIINLPYKWGFLKTTIDSLIAKRIYKIPVTVRLIDDGNKPSGYIKSLFLLNRSWLRNFSILKNVSSSGTVLSGNIFLKSHQVSKSKESLFDSVQKLFELNHKQIEPLPFYWRNQPKVADNFIFSKPKLKDILLILIQANVAFFKALIMSNKKLEISDKIVIDSRFLKKEIVHTMESKMHLFLFHNWLKKYFSVSQKEMKLYYDDEFYDTGRVISHAAGLFKQVKTNGLQHGHFMEAHTVYLITDAEIEAGLPKPDCFITWGEYYNRIFKMNTQLPDDYTQALGNPNYILIDSKKDFPRKINKVLWCLTTKECMQVEWDLIYEGLRTLNAKLFIRLHPIPHIKKGEVEELISDRLTYRFSEENDVMDAINASDLVLVSAHSTTFLDAYVNNKLCVRLVSRFWDGVHQISSDYLKTANTKKHFKASIKSFDLNMGEIQEDNNDLERSNDNWTYQIKKD
jgi:hypothetical protein